MPSPAARSAACRLATSRLMASPPRRRCSVTSALVTAAAAWACWAFSVSTVWLLTSVGWPATSWLIQPARYSYACAT